MICRMTNCGRTLSTWMVLLGVWLSLSTGCSRADRWDLSGNVTYGGNPIAEGHITFDPSKTGVGGGFAKISHGKFDTRVEGRNHPGGPHKVTIAAYKGLKNPKNPDSDVLLLFPAYEVDVELPTSTSTMDFDVPADWRGAGNAPSNR